MILLFVLTFIAGFGYGMLVGFEIVDSSTPLVSKALVVCLGSLAFLISGCLTPSKRWRRFAVVVAITWLLSAGNILLGLPPERWLISIFTLTLMALIGGGLSHLFQRTPRTANGMQSIGD